MNSAANEPARMIPLAGSFKLDPDLLLVPVSNGNERATPQQATRDIQSANEAAGKRVVPKKHCGLASPSRGRVSLRCVYCFA